MIKRISLSLLAILSVASLNAQTTFLSTPSDAKSLSLGGATSAYSTDGFSTLNNIAATATSESVLGVGASYLNWQPSYFDSSIITVGAFYKPIEKLSVGVSYQYEALPSQSIITSTGSENGSFSPNGMSISVGAAYAITDALSVGASAQYVSTAIYTLNGSAIGADLSLDYRAECYNVALVIDNLELSSKDITMPTTVSVAASTQLLNLDVHSVDVMAKAGYVISPSDMASPIAAVGLEYGLKQSYFVRAGYSYSDSSTYMSDYASIGAGASISGVNLDFAYLIPTQSDSTLSGTFMISGSLLF